ncbi:MAG: hypothetical protein IPI73_13075 [Betaproteobacteria bacterium]|nr:hypothetical protein [Betaproteobacteria bacterium]
MKPAIPAQAAFCGVALTCDAPPADNLAVVAALGSVQPGDVLVAATAGHTGCAVTGDLVLGMAKNCGAVGLVTDGCARPAGDARGLPCYCVFPGHDRRPPGGQRRCSSRGSGRRRDHPASTAG